MRRIFRGYIHGIFLSSFFSQECKNLNKNELKWWYWRNPSIVIVKGDMLKWIKYVNCKKLNEFFFVY